ncbi:hypothetical protein ACQR1W_31770 [Bradyrhizobium sp. HKCCYLS1011]|uniref:hypothetical protein n=1 Tax=Bradyrhizobium sp. HKCCYLS1011 TaxID=3420733 RepID=UPI003EBDF261
MNVNPNTGTRVRRISAMRLLAYLIGNNLTTIKIEMDTHAAADNDNAESAKTV